MCWCVATDEYGQTAARAARNVGSSILLRPCTLSMSRRSRDQELPEEATPVHGGDMRSTTRANF